MAVLTKTQFDAKVVALQAAITALLTSAPGARAISGADQRSVAGDIREILGDASDSMPFLPNVASWSNGMADPTGGAAGDGYLQFNASNVLTAVWLNVAGTWAGYTTGTDQTARDAAATAQTEIEDHEANHPSGGGGTVSTDATLDGDGSAGDPLSLADDAVTTAKIEALAVHTGKLNDDAVTAAKLADNAVHHDSIVDNAVRPDNIQANAVTEAKIADGAVTVAKMDSGSAADGDVATADGSGGVAFEAATGGGGGGTATAERTSIYLDAADVAQATTHSAAFDEAIVAGYDMEFVLFNGGAAGDRRGYARMTSDEFLLLTAQTAAPTDTSEAQGFLVRQPDLSGTSTSPANTVDIFNVWQGATATDSTTGLAGAETSACRSISSLQAGQLVLTAKASQRAVLTRRYSPRPATPTMTPNGWQRLRAVVAGQFQRTPPSTEMVVQAILLALPMMRLRPPRSRSMPFIPTRSMTARFTLPRSMMLP